jgi:hypothetical protein
MKKKLGKSRMKPLKNNGNKIIKDGCTMGKETDSSDNELKNTMESVKIEIDVVALLLGFTFVTVSLLMSMPKEINQEVIDRLVLGGFSQEAAQGWVSFILGQITWNTFFSFIAFLLHLWVISFILVFRKNYSW